MQKQVQIYPDSADAGVRATPEIKGIIRNCLLTLPDMAIPVWGADRPIVQRQYRSNVWWSSEEGTLVLSLAIVDIQDLEEYFSIEMRPLTA